MKKGKRYRAVENAPPPAKIKQVQRQYETPPLRQATYQRSRRQSNS